MNGAVFKRKTDRRAKLGALKLRHLAVFLDKTAKPPNWAFLGRVFCHSLHPQNQVPFVSVPHPDGACHQMVFLTASVSHFRVPITVTGEDVYI